MRQAWSFFQLVRLDFCLLTFLSVFVPLVVRTGEVGSSIRRAVPLLFISMCTFIVNDLDDIERDVVNHPERPLPSGRIAPALAVIYYFMCLGAALLTIRSYAEIAVQFWYYLLLIASISYGYVIEFTPAIKAPYVAACVSVPVIIIAITYPRERDLITIAVALFLFALGRELCGDVVDRRGDRPSILHAVSPQSIGFVAFLLHVVALVLLATRSADGKDAAALLLVAALTAIAGDFWFRHAKYDSAITVMKGQMFLGLYYIAR